MQNNTIAVLGASGKSGRAFVKEALAKGYKIRAGVRSTPLPEQPNLEVITCDATISSDVARLIQGCTAVVSLIGHVRGSSATVQTEAMRVVVEQMKLQDITRIVSLTGTGVRVEGDKPSLIDTLANAAIKFIDADRINDGVQHAEILKNSELDWTIVRVLKLSNRPAAPFTLKQHGPAKILTSRAEVAQAILQVLDSSEWIQLAPVVSTK